MEKYHLLDTDFWKDPIVSEEMNRVEKCFYIYLLTNPNMNPSGIYQITKNQMAIQLGYSIESIHALMKRFIKHYKLISYNPETKELTINKQMMRYYIKTEYCH